MISPSLLFSFRHCIHPCFSYVYDTLFLYVIFLKGLGFDWFDTPHGLDGRIGWIGYLIRGVFGKRFFWISVLAFIFVSRDVVSV